jgi:acyl carrier protein
VRDGAGAAARLRRLILERLNIEVPGDAVDLIEQGVLDSLNVVDLLLHIEREWGIRVSVDDAQIDDFRTIASIARYVERCRNAAVADSG